MAIGRFGKFSDKVVCLYPALWVGMRIFLSFNSKDSALADAMRPRLSTFAPDIHIYYRFSVPEINGIFDKEATINA
jgi:hypothetical protein